MAGNHQIQRQESGDTYIFRNFVTAVTVMAVTVTAVTILLEE